MNNAMLENNNLFSEIMKIDQIIVGIASNAGEELVNEVIQHISKAGGKRLRPLLTIMSAKIFENCNENTILLAAAVEFIHTATLLHDDVIDKSSVRRGLSTANYIWGDKTSILVGDYLFSQAFKLMVKTNSLEALSSLAKASSLISRAEITQLRLIGELNISLSDYIKIITEKTAVLFAAACKVGAISAKSRQNYTQYLYNYGLHFGIIFQIIDDYLDYFGKKESIGKQIGIDFFENKITLPIILLINNCNEVERKFLNTVFRKECNKGFNELNLLLELLIKYGINKKIESIVNEYFDKCLDSLQNLPQNEITDCMRLITQDSLKRIV